MMKSEVAAPRVVLSRRAFFSCGRRLYRPEWSEELNRATFGRDFGPHGHEYAVSLVFGGPISPEDGMIVNIAEIKPSLQNAVSRLDGRFLNGEVAFFAVHVPTAENIARFLWGIVPHRAGNGHLVRLELQESGRTRVQIDSADTLSAMKTSRTYEFAAAHRLFTPALSEAQNFERFDKCSNPAGHGHNFTLVVTIEGQPDAQTGFIIAPQILDDLVNREIYERFDHKHLNVDCPEFENLVPTSENLAKVIFEILSAKLARDGFKLAKIGLHETHKNYFEVETGDQT